MKKQKLLKEITKLLEKLDRSKEHISELEIIIQRHQKEIETFKNNQNKPDYDKISLIELLQKKIHSLYSELNYDERHKFNSIKKHLDTMTIESCNDINDLFMLANILNGRLLENEL